MQLGYRTGTITGMLTDGLGLLGGSIIFLIYGEHAYEALLGFGFGGTLLALFMRVGGGTWDRNTWGDAIEDAVKAAQLPAGTTAYTLRHSTITDLVTAGLPLLTVAQISGTSAEMIERHYGHLVRDAAVKALEALAL